ncbi:PASTA domain-containing protein [Sediminibacterium soli]|uniref:PASTA domain-containing protein n=1 Tax=Sediminibacterium soli TaxID=2698829 RepID=UPI001379786C|nr:PASTA domain-containing protein [Sediminibacterium soli]NCI46895.1 PASTA domain-containing protein [Sediminibacterium soli]
MKAFIEKYVTSKPLWMNILVALGVVIILVFLFFLSLSWLTRYGKYEKVPSVMGQNITAATKMLEDRGFDVVIQDSIYIDSIAKQAVVRQTPEADAMVKTGRTIYLTINRSIAPQVEMPNLAGFSIKSAEMYLQSLGLRLGYVTYKPDIARNSVLEQLFNDAPIAPGTRIPIGSAISFVLGSGEGPSQANIPDVVGMTLAEARAYLLPLGINIGAVLPMGSIKDSSSAYVVRQSPEPLSDSLSASGARVPNKVRPGQLMDVYISGNSPLRDTLQ